MLLERSVLAGLLVPFNITALADEKPARGNEIYAMIYQYYDNLGNRINDSYELVLQKGNTPDPGKELIKCYGNFADKNSEPAWRTNYCTKVLKIDIKDKIAPKYMRDWFYDFRNVTDDNFLHLKNLDTSQCQSLYLAFSYLRSIKSWI